MAGFCYLLSYWGIRGKFILVVVFSGRLGFSFSFVGGVRVSVLVFLFVERGLGVYWGVNRYSVCIE